MRPKDPYGVRTISHDITSPKDLGTLKSYTNMELSEDLRGKEWFLEIISKPGVAALTAAELMDVFIVIRYDLTL
ncbi:MAG: hypothetical protein HUU34_15220 [Saprospiraceae bacterium]|nr:hypothetical protein [Saprospiraceae bacterium]